jgi:hypothetical protein
MTADERRYTPMKTRTTLDRLNRSGPGLGALTALFRFRPMVHSGGRRSSAFIGGSLAFDLRRAALTAAD